MKKIIIVNTIDHSSLKMIRGYIPEADKENIYMTFGSQGIQNQDSLNALGFKYQRLPVYDVQYRDKFLREYIDLIGSIGKENNTLEWWATDIASKNRFTSRIPELLTCFLGVVETIKNQQFGIMVVINPDWTIVSSLKKACLCHEIDIIIGSGFIKKRFFSTLAGRFRAFSSAMRQFAKIFIKSACCRFVLGRKIEEVIGEKESYYVIKTFIYNNSFSKDGNYKDAFFGKLPDFLNAKRKVLVLAVLLGDYCFCIKKIRKCDSIRIIPFESIVAIVDLIRAFKTFILSSISVSNKFFFGYEIADIVKNELVRTWSGIQYYQLIHYYVLRRFSRVVKVDTFLLTYENNPWEKMCITALRMSSPDTFIIGYQHTIVAHASANMFMSRYEKGIMPIPDKILTVGDATKNIMKRYGDFGEVPICSSCGLRFEYLFNMGRLARNNNGNILLGLEGIKEAYKMVRYVLGELGGNDKYKVRIRTHPVLPWQHFQHNHGFDLAKHPNFHLSPGGPLKDDVDWADTVIYWGSTVGVEALNVGRAVIHYNIGSILNYDPLFENSHLKWVVSESDKLVDTLEKINILNNEEFTFEWEKAKMYLNTYFHPITDENLKEFVKTQDIMVPELNVCAT